MRVAERKNAGGETSAFSVPEDLGGFRQCLYWQVAVIIWLAYGQNRV